MEALRTISVSLVVSIFVAIVVAVFAVVFDVLSSCFQGNTWLVWLLPVSGMLTFALYRSLGISFSTGTSSVVEDVSANRSLSARLMPGIFGGTCLSVIAGGSVGKEAAALQIGASLASLVGNRLGVGNASLKRRYVMCGMASALSVLLGAPLASALFVLELFRSCRHDLADVIAVLLSAELARLFAFAMSVDALNYPVANPAVEFRTVAVVAIIIAGGSLVGCAFCFAIVRGRKLLGKCPHLATLIVGGVLYAMMLVLFDGSRFAGSGMIWMNAALDGTVNEPYFVGKLLCTAFVLVAGFKGGEIMPTLCIGATFGAYMGFLLGVTPSFSAAVGLVVLFSVCTNCPLAAVLLGVEAFGIACLPWYAISALAAFLLTSRFGLYPNTARINEIMAELKRIYRGKRNE